MANPKVWLATNELCEHKYLLESPPGGAAKKVIEEGTKIRDAADPDAGDADVVPTPLAVAQAGMVAAKAMSEATRVMMGAAQAWKATRRAAILDFDLAPVNQEKRPMAMLRLFDAPPTEKEPRAATTSGRRITAYWVPYRATGAGHAPIRLGAAANYMFTNALTGCRITVVPEATTGMKDPLVMHIAGAPPEDAPPEAAAGNGTAWRNEVQGRVLARAVKVPANLPPPLIRTFTSTKDPGPGGYKGSGGVMVVGIRDVKTGNWSFVAQWHDGKKLHLSDILAG